MDKFGHPHMAGGLAIVRRSVDMTTHGTPHIRHFFGTFIDEQDDQFDIRMVGADRIGNVLNEDRFARAWGRDDQPGAGPCRWG